MKHVVIRWNHLAKLPSTSIPLLTAQTPFPASVSRDEEENRFDESAGRLWPGKKEDPRKNEGPSPKRGEKRRKENDE